MADELSRHQFDLNVNVNEDINLVDGHPPNRSRRHMQHQIQGLQAFFKDCPTPDYKQRSALGLELGLEAKQVKFWFQNKRTQLKTRHDHLKNAELRAENKRLKDENTTHLEHLESVVACVTCGCPVAIRDISVDEHRLRAENVRLREEIHRLSMIAAQCIGKSIANSDNVPDSTPL